MKKSNTLIASILLALILWASYSTLALKKYYSHQTRGDLTAYAQGLWNTLHGHPFASTFNYSVHNFWGGDPREITEDNSNIFGIHFNGVLVVLVPLYRVMSTPSTLILLQAAFVAASSVVIYRIACDLTKHRPFSLLIQFSYLLHLSLVTAVLSEFHAYPLTVLFSSLLIWAHRRHNRLGYYLSLLLLLSTQENAAIPAFFFGVYLVLSRSSVKKGLTTIVLGALSLLVTTKVLIPFFSPFNHYLFENAYGTPLGSSYAEVITNSLKHPDLLARTFVNRANLVYLSKLLLPVLPLAAFSPLALGVGIFALLPNLMSSAMILKSLTTHYEAVAVPYLYFALILGVRYLLNRFSYRHTLPLIALSLVFALGTQYKLLTSHIFSPGCVWSCQLYDAKDAEIDEMLTLIPEDTSVSTQDYISGHLTNRRQLYLFPVYYKQVEYLPLSTGSEIWPLEPSRHEELLVELRSDQKYEILYESENYLLFHRL